MKNILIIIVLLSMTGCGAVRFSNPANSEITQEVTEYNPETGELKKTKVTISLDNDELSKEGMSLGIRDGNPFASTTGVDVTAIETASDGKYDQLWWIGIGMIAMGIGLAYCILAKTPVLGGMPWSLPGFCVGLGFVAIYAKTIMAALSLGVVVLVISGVAVLVIVPGAGSNFRRWLKGIQHRANAPDEPASPPQSSPDAS